MNMETARTLRDVFAALAGHGDAGADAAPAESDHRALLAPHEGLPDDLLSTAIASYAGTAPAEVAQHLAPVVTARVADPQHTGLSLLASAPVGNWEGEVELDSGHADPSGLHLGDLGSADSLDQHADPAGPDQRSGDHDVSAHDVSAHDVWTHHDPVLAGEAGPDAGNDHDGAGSGAGMHGLDTHGLDTHGLDTHGLDTHGLGLDALSFDDPAVPHPGEDDHSGYGAHHEEAQTDHESLPGHDGLDGLHH